MVSWGLADLAEVVAAGPGALAWGPVALALGCGLATTRGKSTTGGTARAFFSDHALKSPPAIMWPSQSGALC